jgi:hypothetical protein
MPIFAVEAFGASGQTVAVGEIDRAVVDRAAFLESTSGA